MLINADENTAVDFSLKPDQSPSRYHAFTHEKVKGTTSGLVNGKIVMCASRLNPSVDTCTAIKLGTNETVPFAPLPIKVSHGPPDLIEVEGNFWFVGGLQYPSRSKRKQR